MRVSVAFPPLAIVFIESGNTCGSAMRRRGFDCDADASPRDITQTSAGSSERKEAPAYDGEKLPFPFWLARRFIFACHHAIAAPSVSERLKSIPARVVCVRVCVSMAGVVGRMLPFFPFAVESIKINVVPDHLSSWGRCFSRESERPTHVCASR